MWDACVTNGGLDLSPYSKLCWVPWVVRLDREGGQTTESLEHWAELGLDVTGIWESLWIFKKGSHVMTDV